MKMWLQSPCMMVFAAIAACGGTTPHVPVKSSPSTPGLSPVAALGEQLFHDESLSVSGRLSCQTCHRPEFAHAAPPGDLVSKGGPGMDVPVSAILPRSATRAHAAVRLRREGHGIRRTLSRRSRSLARRAGEVTFLDAREMANATPADVVARLRQSPNATRFRDVFGADALDDPAEAFPRLAAAIAQFEVEDPEFHRFDSKYDAYLAGKARLTPEEERGLSLFEDPKKGNCAACHPNRRGDDGAPPLFTDFTYDNVGVPRNAKIPANADPAYLTSASVARGARISRRATTSAAHSRSRRFATSRARRRTSTMGPSTTCATSSISTCGATRIRACGTRSRRRAAGSSTTCPNRPDAVNVSEVPYDRKPGETPALTPAEIDDVVAFLKTLDDGYN